MELSLFDLHCDTAYEMLRTGQGLTENRLAVSLTHAKAFKQYIQVMALWTDRRLSDEEGWEHFSAMLQNLRRDEAIRSHRAELTTKPWQDTRPQLLLGVEDARILCCKLSRVDTLWREGVRILTPLWQGETVIGGSHDTKAGLTDFGREALDSAARLGMILDISHASEASADEIFSIAAAHGRPVIASHSDAYAVCPVSRNLRDRQVHRILDSGGVIGLNLYEKFLTAEPTAGPDKLLLHIEHFLSLGAEEALCLGCDMDGCTLPEEISNLSALPRLAELMLRHGYSEKLIHGIFFENAMRFATKNL